MKALSCVFEGNLSMQYCLGPYQYPSSIRWYIKIGVDRMKEPGQDEDCVSSSSCDHTLYKACSDWTYSLTLCWNGQIVRITWKLGGNDKSGIIKSAGHTYPDADANNHGYSRGAVAERFQWVDCDIATVPTHSCQSDACGLDCYLKNSKTYISDVHTLTCKAFEAYCIKLL